VADCGVGVGREADDENEDGDEDEDGIMEPSSGRRFAADGR
jgi:hypothetical protein